MKIGIIGFGIMGQIRLKTLPKCSSNFVVKSICEVNQSNIEKIPSTIKVTSNWKDITRDPEIDIVFVCTPNFLTRDCVVDALEQKKHVFSEKPPGRNFSETFEMYEASLRHPELKLMFGFNHRHHEAMTESKKIIDSGELGKILWIRGRYGKAVDESFFDNWRAKKDLSGGGILLDQGIHMLDLFLMMAGNFDSVKADVSNLFWKLDVEDNVFAIFKRNDGVIASLHSTMTQWRHLFSLEIFLEKGHIVINGLLTNSGSYGEEELSVIKNKLSGAHEQEILKKTYTENISWAEEMKSFFNSIEKNTEIEIGTIKDALNVMKHIEMTYKDGNKNFTDIEAF